jgi:hypothetical protein
LTIGFDGVKGHVFGSMEEGLGERVRAVFSATATESMNEVTGFCGSQVVSGEEVRGRGFFRGSWR